MKKRINTSLLICALALSMSNQAFSMSNQEQGNDFSQAYAAYTKAVESKDNQMILETAKQAYELGKAKYAENSINLAALLMNYASATAEQHDKQSKAEAFGFYKQALNIYKHQQPIDKKDIVDTQIKLAETAKNKSLAYDFIIQAIKTADDNKLLTAQVKMMAFLSLSKRYYTKKLGRYAKEALETYQQELPVNSLERVKATFNVARIYEAEKKRSKAAELYEEVIKQFEVLDYSHPFKLAAHARLVGIYENQGESEQSTAHCIAIGSMKPWTDEQEQTPLYRLPPKFPMSYAKRGKSGQVTMEFTISKNGFVKDIEVTESKGGKGFIKESKKAMKKWRYAPKFIDGKPVEAKTKIRLDYTINI